MGKITSTIGISEDAKDLVDSFRKVFPTKVPSYKDTIDNIVYFVKENEEQFIEWIKMKEGEAKI